MKDLIENALFCYQMSGEKLLDEKNASLRDHRSEKKPNSAIYDKSMVRL